jgi:FkbM family methyltransferase
MKRMLEINSAPEDVAPAARAFKQRATDLAARNIILRFRLVEDAMLHISRRYPRARPVQWICFSMSREAAKRPDRVRTVRLPPGPLMQLDISDVYGQVYYFDKVYEPQVTDLIVRSLKPGDTAIDVGANAGYHTLIMAQAVGPKGVVHAFEPNPSLVAMLMESVRLNGFQDRIHINQKAVSTSTESEVPFLLIGGHNTGASSFMSVRAERSSLNDASQTATTVSTVSLDEYALSCGIQSCAFIKIDVEGAEHLVLQGGADMIERVRPRVIMVETRVGEQAHSLLTSCNYTVREVFDEQPESSDGSRSLIANVVYVPVEEINR